MNETATASVTLFSEINILAGAVIWNGGQSETPVSLY